MKKLPQTRFGHAITFLSKERGNCLAACIASILELESAEDALQVQEYHNESEMQRNYWMQKWLADKGYRLTSIGHNYDGLFYIVFGITTNGIKHAHVYQRGRLVHDPFPAPTQLHSIHTYFNLELIEGDILAGYQQKLQIAAQSANLLAQLP